MKNNFDKSFNIMFDIEGGRQLHQNVTESAETYSGIYRKYHDTWVGWAYIDKGEHPPLEVIKSFYKENFWDRVKGDKLPAGVDLAVFDYAVNSDPSDAGIALQQAIGISGGGVDGIIGSGTLAKLSNFLQEDTRARIEHIIDEVCALRLEHMMQSPQSDLREYALGWSRRVCKILKLSLIEVVPF